MSQSRSLLVAQSGGPTAVINSSLVGVVDAALQSGRFGTVLGARRGIEGVLGEEFIDLGRQPRAVLDAVRRTPSAALGTSRQKLDDEGAAQAIAILARHEIHAVAYIGGNDSADTAHRLAAAARDAGYELAVVSVPKTIDNDLPGTDHCPGYGSIARFIALAARDAGRDTESMAEIHPIKLIEVMGRNAGWIAASAALGQESLSDAPQLIFFPERPTRDLQSFVGEIEAAWRAHGQLVAVIPETIRDSAGQPLSGEVSWRDSFGHPYLTSAAAALSRAIEEHLGVRARFDKPGTISRMFMAAASETDLAEAYEVGAAAVRLLLDNLSEVMVTLERVSDEPYEVRTGFVPVDQVANRERHLPDEFIGPDDRSVSEAFRRYALPLIGGPLPPYGRLLDPPPER